ncbi:MAG TPA: hypothetical protein VHN99_07535 [Deinococcales bacterium]|nr:hypothetical protein [Deinococcales bacterium]
MNEPGVLELIAAGPFSFALTGEVLARLPRFNTLERFTPAGTEGGPRHERALATPAGPLKVTATPLPGLGGLDGGLRLTLRGPEEAWPAAVAWANAGFGLSVDPAAFEAVAAQDRLLGPILPRLRGLRPPASDPWEALVGAIVSQQITLRLALRQLDALARQLGGTLHAPGEPPDPLDRGPLPLHPTPLAVLEADPGVYRSAGLSAVKAGALKSAAQAALDGRLAEATRMPALEAVALLTAIRGIGPWTARYWLTSTGRLEALATTDAGLRAAYRAVNDGSLEGLEEWSESLGPVRGWAYWYLIWGAKYAPASAG